ncbi:MAG: hypothetical protein JWR61_1095 [Ferruginibacter sp.]|uniref:hypothetical protein n=1 Tax=Ferruginibacter sp. TaxID=1940288 RepID=UPI00265A5C71|nr:hypothetical protein [Ferruginibacter sp.]MDB5276140.1 hypothetical protein [Ferruginibacter sp.]
MAKLKKTDDEHQLVADVAKLIEESRQQIAQTVNTTLSILAPASHFKVQIGRHTVLR